MANIFLQVQSYVAAYYRNRDEEHPLGLFEPVHFCKFSQEQFVLQSSLRLLNVQKQAESRCYSSNTWNTILSGKSPVSGRSVVERDRNEWPSYREVCTMMGVRFLPNKDNCDYLCIAMPNTVMIGGKQYRTSGLFTLDYSASQQLQHILHNEFVRTLIMWYQADMEFCAEKHINRTRIEMLERFMLHYNIPVGPTKVERESLRRLLNRWLSQALVPSFSRTVISNVDIERIDHKFEFE